MTSGIGRRWARNCGSEDDAVVLLLTVRRGIVVVADGDVQHCQQKMEIVA